jgi:hypothetical protein
VGLNIMAVHNIFIGEENMCPDITNLEVIIFTTETHFTFIKNNWATVEVNTPFPISLFNRVFASPLLSF